MNTYKLKWTRLQSEIFRLLCIKCGQDLNLRGIAKLLKVSPAAISKVIVDLEKDSLIIMEKSKTMNLVTIRLNRDDSKTINMKRIENMKLLYESSLADFLHDAFQGCTVILFGSYSRGEDTVSSDIDIAVIGTKDKNIDMNKFDKLLERKITINYYTSWKDIHKNLKDNILNGMVLSGVVDI
jgi:predicted nucleotidyltransferase